VPLGAAEPLGAAVPSPSTAAKGNGAPGRTRDELVAAWGDVVLARLPLKLRAYYAAGRFVSAERDGDGRTSAVFAVPNAAHVVKAEPMRPEVERALSDHFGAPVALRLVADDDPESPGGAPAVPSGTSAPPDDGGLDEVAELLASEPVDEKDLPASGLAWAEGRLLEAFPGAEEI
jgi:hypothetical protein